MSRFFRPGTSKVHWLTTIASLPTPTRAEITAGTNLTPWVAALTGFDVDQQLIEIPDVTTNTVIQRTGSNRIVPSAFVLYDDLETAGLRVTLAAGTTGYVVLMPYGDTATRRAEVWRVRTMLPTSGGWSTESKAATYTVPVAVLSFPTLGAVVPAA